MVKTQVGFNQKYFSGIPIYRPNINSELKLTKQAEYSLRSAFFPGKYSNPEIINSILQHQFNFFQKKSNNLIPLVASRHFLEFVLFQYDQASNIESLYKKGKLTQKEADNWEEIGPKFRRAAKYIAELIVQIQPNEAPNATQENLFEIADEVWIASEEMVEHYLLSDQTFMVFQTKLFLKFIPTDIFLFPT